jgi:hypothetical protein
VTPALTVASPSRAQPLRVLRLRTPAPSAEPVAPRVTFEAAPARIVYEPPVAAPSRGHEDFVAGVEPPPRVVGRRHFRNHRAETGAAGLLTGEPFHGRTYAQRHHVQPLPVRGAARLH